MSPAGAAGGDATAGAETAELPVLCKRCGAPVEPDAELRLACRYCGLEDHLPQEIHERTRELRQRLRAAARTAMQLDGLQRSLAGLFEERRTFIRALLPLVVPIIFILGYMAFSSVMALRSTPAVARREVASHMAGSLVSAGLVVMVMPLAMGAGMLLSRASYRRRVRPLLLGRPPREPGRPARCRSCGGELAEGRGPFVPCRYCGTPNLLSAELRQDRERLLAAEEAAHRDQARRALGTGARTSHNLGRMLAVAAGASYVAMLMLAGLIQKLVRAAFE